ncbi:MAG: NifU family protein [Candidatus Uhrbacteria bacterium]
MREKIETILTEVRPKLAADGGNVQLVGVDEEGNITLKIEGACRGCPMFSLTFTHGIEKMIREQIPEVKKIIYS